MPTLQYVFNEEIASDARRLLEGLKQDNPDFIRFSMEFCPEYNCVDICVYVHDKYLQRVKMGLGILGKLDSFRHSPLESEFELLELASRKSRESVAGRLISCSTTEL